MNRLDMTREIEKLLGVPTVGLWKASKPTVEAIWHALQRRFICGDCGTPLAGDGMCNTCSGPDYPEPQMTWEPIGDDALEGGRSVLHSTTQIAGLSMHVMAIRVRYDEEASMQVVDSEEGGHEDLFDRYAIAADPDGPFQTTKLPGFAGEYVLFADPFC